jgi:hypothetical protein
MEEMEEVTAAAMEMDLVVGRAEGKREVVMQQERHHQARLLV